MFKLGAWQPPSLCSLFGIDDIALAIGGSALIGGITSFLGGETQANAAQDAAQAQLQAAREANALARETYYQTRADYAPYRGVGTNALLTQSDLMGLARPMPEAPAASTQQGGQGAGFYQMAGRNQADVPVYNFFATGAPVGTVSSAAMGAAPDNSPAAIQARQQAAFGQFRTDPGYGFAVSEGTKALQNSAAARGILNSGATAKALTRFGQGLADQSYGNWFNRLGVLSGVGQTATSGLGTLGSDYAARTGQNLIGGATAYGQGLIGAGNARASAYGGISDAIGGGLQNYYDLPVRQALLNRLNTGGGGAFAGGLNSNYFTYPSFPEWGA